MKLSKITGTFMACALLISCAEIPQTSPEAAKVQVHTQMSTLLKDCKNLGAVTAKSTSQYGLDTTGTQLAQTQAKNGAREQVVSLGGDTLVVLNYDMQVFNNIGIATYQIQTLQGTAMKCYR